MVAKVNANLKMPGPGGPNGNLARIEKAQGLTKTAKPNGGRPRVPPRKVGTGVANNGLFTRSGSTAVPVFKVAAPPDQKIDPWTREKTPQLEQTAAAFMARADPITELLNSAVKSFYQVASGGLAARRSNPDLGASLRSVAEMKDQLAALIQVSAPFVAGNSAGYPALGKWRQGLIKSLRSIDDWLMGANAYAAGLTGPGGNKTTKPALVRPPSVVLTSSVSPRNATQEAEQIRREYARANTAINGT